MAFGDRPDEPFVGDAVDAVTAAGFVDNPIPALGESAFVDPAATSRAYLCLVEDVADVHA